MEGEYREGPVYVGLIVEAVYYPPEMINQGLLPVAMKPTGKYRQSFRQYEKNGDISLMVYVLCKSELESIQKVQQLIQKKDCSVRRFSLRKVYQCVQCAAFCLDLSLQFKDQVTLLTDVCGAFFALLLDVVQTITIQQYAMIGPVLVF